MTIELVYRVRCSGPCRRWLSLPDDYEPGEDIPLAALEPKPTAARAGMWPDEHAARRAAFAAGWSSGICPDCRATEQDTPRREPHPTQADVDHALAVSAKFHGQPADVPAAGAGQDETQEPTGWMGATDLASDREIAALAATGIVGYRQDNGRLLHCLAHKPAPASRYADFHEVGPDDLEDGGICVHPRCGRDLLARWPGQS
ncbi:hypothetical protein ACFXKY_07815 [Streptomyces canus]|uniref:hypothetical protein n=1 Tax=Streptomyces canus TaxID=58343 RepID=UPI003693C54A